MTAPGNKMRWDCNLRGCFNEKKRPKLEVFADCFPRGINFGDVDMVAEIRGQFLFIEWKPAEGATPRGQQLLHNAMMHVPRITLFVVVGDAETMAVRSWVERRGPRRRRVEGDLSALKARVAAWAQWADAQEAA